MIKPVSGKKPAAKTLPSEKKSLVRKAEERVQTAEGWKRTTLKKRKTKKPE